MFRKVNKAIYILPLLSGFCLLFMSADPESHSPKPTTLSLSGDSLRIIHTFVALCDNDSQGIVPVSKRMGNGNDPENNLYWGNGYGVRTFFNRSDDWMLIAQVKNPRPNILERCAWKHRRYNCIMVADAYIGARIKPCTIDFLNSSAGNGKDTFTVNIDEKRTTLQLGKATLINYVGHNGLMDFELQYPGQKDSTYREVIILACASKMYFRDALKSTGAYPLLWTTNLMGPEAYTLKAAIDGWLKKESGEQIRIRAAQAYDQYVHCGYNGALRLFATGF